MKNGSLVYYFLLLGLGFDFGFGLCSLTQSHSLSLSQSRSVSLSLSLTPCVWASLLDSQLATLDVAGDTRVRQGGGGGRRRAGSRGGKSRGDVYNTFIQADTRYHGHTVRMSKQYDWSVSV